MIEHGTAFASEQEAREALIDKLFPFMFDRTCYFALPCSQCRGFHLVCLPTDREPEKREAKKAAHAKDRSG